MLPTVIPEGTSLINVCNRSGNGATCDKSMWISGFEAVALFWPEVLQVSAITQLPRGPKQAEDLNEYWGVL